MRSIKILVATERSVLQVDPQRGAATPAQGLGERLPSTMAWDPWVPHRAWCGTTDDGILRSDDAGGSWEPAGLPGHRITALSPSPARKDLIWAGTEPSAVWYSKDGGERWEEAPGLKNLPSSSEWSFPPRPHTHHVRWIACHPELAGQIWVAIEAGALVMTSDGGRTWADRVRGGPLDTHELNIHPRRPDALRVSAGDGYFESDDGGHHWTSPQAGLDVTYLRSVVVDPGNPDIVVVSAASGPRSAYVVGRSDGRLFRRVGGGSWERVSHGWPDSPDTIAALLRAEPEEGSLWAADGRGVHRSDDSGGRWAEVVAFETQPQFLRGFAVSVLLKSTSGGSRG
jgi:photosystem II stability/assembly factor-like uncharacterized protein